MIKKIIEIIKWPWAIVSIIALIQFKFFNNSFFLYISAILSVPFYVALGIEFVRDFKKNIYGDKP